MRLTLRDYQQSASDAMIRELANGKNPLCVLPTGSGKSLVLSDVIRRVYPDQVLVLSHVKELLQQDADKLARMAPDIPQAFFVAGLGEKNAKAPVVFGSVQSVYRNLNLFTTRRALVAVDEAHLCPRKADAMYGAIFSHFAASPRGGFTATPSRMDSGSLVDGDNAWFDSIAIDVPVKELIERGFLVPLSGVIEQQQADLAGVQKSMGDFAQGQAEQAVIRTLSLPEAVGSMKKHAAGRKSWLVFAAGIEHAEKVLAELRAQGVRSEMITSENSGEDRQRILDEFRAGEFQALVNVGVLTTGFDAPRTDCIVSLRPTQSKVLWQQMLGRGMRLFDQKHNCLLLDYVGNLDRMGGVDVVESIKDFRNGEDLEQLSPRTGKGKRRKGPIDPELYEVSATDPMMTGQSFDALVNKMSFFTVNSKRYPGKKMLVACYDIQDQFGRALSARSFVCIEYEGGARYHALRWFSKRGIAKDKAPSSAETALLYARALPKPTEVTARYDRSLSCFLIESETFA
jgi:DNA repair protein RadD